MKIRAFFLVILSTLTVDASASLIGDTITTAHHFPNVGNVIGGPFSVTVIAGTGDTTTPYFPYTVNPEADRILIDHTQPGWNTGVSFNGLVIDSLNDSSGGALAGITVDTNISNWSDSRLSFDADTIWLNFGLGTSLDTGFVNLILDFGDANGVPVPATLALLGLGLAGIGFQRRKKFTAT